MPPRKAACICAGILTTGTEGAGTPAGLSVGIELEPECINQCFSGFSSIRVIWEAHLKCRSFEFHLKIFNSVYLLCDETLNYVFFTGSSGHSAIAGSRPSPREPWPQTTCSPKHHSPGLALSIICGFAAPIHLPYLTENKRIGKTGSVGKT